LTIAAAAQTNGPTAGCKDAKTGRSGDPYASTGQGSLTITVSDHSTEDSQDTVNFCYCPPNSKVQLAGATWIPADGQPLQFQVDGNASASGTATLSATLKNLTDQTEYFARGVDVVIHLQNGQAERDVHLNSAVTSLAPGQDTSLQGTTSLDSYGQYVVSGTVTFGFVNPNG
jgi:hypothetical protein